MVIEVLVCVCVCALFPLPNYLFLVRLLQLNDRHSLTQRSRRRQRTVKINHFCLRNARCVQCVCMCVCVCVCVGVCLLWRIHVPRQCVEKQLSPLWRRCGCFLAVFQALRQPAPSALLVFVASCGIKCVAMASASLSPLVTTP